MRPLDDARTDAVLGLAGALSRLREHSAPVLLDSAGGAPCRYSLLGVDPVAGPPRDLAGLRALLATLAPAREPVPGPFAGGFLGALAYELGVEGEELDLPAEPWGQPLVVGGLYTDFLVRDERSGETWLVIDDAERPDGPSAREREERLLDELAGPSRAAPFRTTREPERRVTPAEHRRRIERAREEIAAGEIYQANVAHPFLAEVEGHPVDVYLRLRETNPAPYMGYAGWEGGALLSSSPELLLEVGDGLARTRPIKGTAPRGTTPAEDAACAEALLASEKDLAELAMIVDLERNDLGRVALPGAVEVAAFPCLETYAAVHHLVADVRARLAPGVGSVDVLAALFPGGSITGAPKLRSMEVIAALESEGRGFFTGSLGFAGADGRAAWNVLIRTLLWRPAPGRGESRGEVSFRVGGGITWSSDAEAEDLETLHKAAALAAALTAASPEPAP